MLILVNYFLLLRDLLIEYFQSWREVVVVLGRVGFRYLTLHLNEGLPLHRETHYLLQTSSLDRLGRIFETLQHFLDLVHGGWLLIFWLQLESHLR